MPKPDYRLIAQLEAEEWGEVFTKESKQYDPLYVRYRRGLRESAATLDAREQEFDDMIAEVGGL